MYRNVATTVELQVAQNLSRASVSSVESNVWRVRKTDTPRNTRPIGLSRVLVSLLNYFRSLNSRYKSKADLYGAEAPLLVYWLEPLKKCEDKSVAESAEKRQPRYNRFCNQHVEGTTPNREDLFHGQAKTMDLVRTIDFLRASFASSLRFSVQ